MALFQASELLQITQISLIPNFLDVSQSLMY